MRILGLWRTVVGNSTFDEKDRVWRTVVIHRGDEYHLETYVHDGEIVKTSLRGSITEAIPVYIPIDGVHKRIKRIMDAYQRHADHYHQLGKHWLADESDREQIELARRREELGLVRSRK